MKILKKKKAAPGGGELLAVSMKGLALIDLVESGVIPREENGDVDTAAFERFWAAFEPRLAEAITRTIRVSLGR